MSKLQTLSKLQTMLDRWLDTFFHLPTLVVIAIIAGLILWQLYDFGFNLGDTFIRLNSNRGGITLHWANGCCEVDW